MAKKTSVPPPAPAVVSHRERVMERTREEILVTAARLVVQHQGRSVSLQEIATEVGLTAPALYAYFESKQALFVAIVALIEREAAEVFQRPSPAGADFADRLRRFAEGHIELTERRRDVFLAMFSLKFSGEALPDTRRKAPPLAHFEALQAWFQREARPADLRGCPVADAAATFYGLLHAFFVRSLVGDSTRGRSPVIDATDRLLQLFWHGVSGPPRVASPLPPRRTVRR